MAKPAWGKDQPNNYNGEQNCVVLDGGRSWLWNDVGCNLDYLHWICQHCECFFSFTYTGVPFVVSPITADLSHRKPASAGISVTVIVLRGTSKTDTKMNVDKFPHLH